mgnify:CR=1 FL=1
MSNFDRKKRTRFRDQQGILNILKGYGYEENPLEDSPLPGGRVYEATYRGQEVTIVLSIPSSLDTLDPFFRNNRDIDCWIVVDGEPAELHHEHHLGQHVGHRPAVGHDRGTRRCPGR